CPMCCYALAGLEPPHRCPECGFEFDEHTEVWFAPNYWLQHAQYFAPVFALILVFWALMPAFYYRVGRPIQALYMGGAVLCIALVLRAIIRHVRTTKLGQCVAITPKGLFIRNAHEQE